MGQPRWEVRLGSEFVDFDLKSQQQLERAMQAGESQLKLLLAGRSFTVAWSLATDDCGDIAMRSDARPERVRPVGVAAGSSPCVQYEECNTVVNMKCERMRASTVPCRFWRTYGTHLHCNLYLCAHASHRATRTKLCALARVT